MEILAAKIFVWKLTGVKGKTVDLVLIRTE
jgi:hypothetical protein